MEEIEAVRDWLTCEGKCLVLGPHRDVGISADLDARAMEYAVRRRRQPEAFWKNFATAKVIQGGAADTALATLLACRETVVGDFALLDGDSAPLFAH